MIAKENRNIMITLNKNDLKKLEELTKQKSKEIGIKLTKSQVISMLLSTATKPIEKEVKIVEPQPQIIVEARGNTMRPKNTKDMSNLQQMINFLNYDCRLSYSQIGKLLEPNVSDRTIKDYMYGKVKNPSEDKIEQLKKICKSYGKRF